MDGVSRNAGRSHITGAPQEEVFGLFSHADRIPMTPPGGTDRKRDSRPLPPWGVSRMSPYPDVIEFPEYTVTIDPETQTGRYVDAAGTVVEMKHRKSNTGTEQKTRASKGDGKSPSSFDQDSSQDSDQD